MNNNIRNEAKRLGVPFWKIAQRQGVTDSTFSRWLRTELPPEKQAAILQDIQAIAQEQAAQIMEAVSNA